MLISTLIPTIVLLLTIFLGIFLFFNVTRTKAHVSFLFIILAVAFWIFSNLMVDTATKESSVLLWSKITIIGPTFIPVLLYFFSYHFPKKRKAIGLSRKILLFSPSLVLISLSLTSWNIKDVVLSPTSPPTVTPGPLYLFLFLYFLLYTCLTFSNLFKSYSKSNQIEKLQIKYVFSGGFVSIFLGILTNLILLFFGVSEAASFGPSSIIFFLLSTSYAIFKHRLFEIKTFLVELLILIITLILFTQILITQSFGGKILNTVVFLLFCIFGYQLIKATLQEIKRREQMERMAKKLEKAYKELKKLDVAKTEFVSIASHQLRTPLTAIKGYLSLIQEEAYGKFPKQMKKPIENTYVSTERLIRLVNDLLNISRIESGKVTAKVEKIYIEDIIESVINELQNLAEQKNIYIRWERPEKSSVKVLADKDQLRQVVLNLIDNAIRYTATGGVTITTELKDKNCRVKIKDTGPGMVEEEISQLFVSFSRGSVGRKASTEGTGLGLYIAKKFAEMQKGKVWAESLGKGKGSTFYIEIPRNHSV